ncbi:MAG: hypothetical protein RLZ35_665 [Pseudomonadota bacterium]|jgi:uncharacterized DUF497 family protein
MASFEWDSRKNEENINKHGISFYEAQQVFLDPSRVIAKDKKHSNNEPRFYCFGKLSSGIATVRFTYRNSIIRLIGAGYWRRGKKIYEQENSKIR